MKIKKYKIKIKGTTPLIWNCMKRDLELEKSKIKKDEYVEWEENNWQRKADFYNQKPRVPSRWLKSCLIESCKKNRIVPHFATRKNETYTFYIKSCMLEENTKPVCKTKELEYHGEYVGGQGKK